MLNLPNFLTLIRILTVPVFLVLLTSHLYVEAFVVFLLGGVTDFLDGAIARWMNQQTAVGAYLDPVADKLLVATSFIVLGLHGALPIWLVMVVLSRDAIIVIGYVIIYYLVEERLHVKPSLVGKLSTASQLLTVGVTVVMLISPTFPRAIADILIFATAATTVVSGFQYTYQGLIWLQKKASSLPPLS